MTIPCENELACPHRSRARNEVRISLALFAMTNFTIGMMVFMFTLCSSAPEHVKHLSMLFTDFPGLVEHLGDHGDSPAEHRHKSTAD